MLTLLYCNTNLNHVWCCINTLHSASQWKSIVGQLETIRCTFNFDSASQLSPNDTHISEHLMVFAVPHKGRSPEANLLTTRLHLVNA